MARDEAVRDLVERLELPFNALGVDPYGVSKKHLTIGLGVLGFLYRRYFRVKAVGLQNVPKRGRAMLVGNHSGGYALDGAMVITSMLLEMDPPRLAQGMAEKFINQLPLGSVWSSRCGQLTGLPEHAERLLMDDRLLMVFPEGAKGTAKLFKERYSLVDFGTGFVRLALKTKSPIVPLGFVGGGDAVPTVLNSRTLGKLLGVPYVPVTPYGIAAPLPAKLVVHYGAPLVFEGTGDEEDSVIKGYVDTVKARIAELIEAARVDRRGEERVMKVLIVGVGGALARLVALRLRESGHKVIGIDRRPWWDAPRDIEVHEVDIRKRAAEDVFRQERPECVVHMATVNALSAAGEERARINMGGTRSVFDHSINHGVKHIVVVGRHTYYGATADSPLYHTENEPPQGMGNFPELADLVAADLYAANMLWREPQITTTVLRMVYTLGPSKTGTLASFLKGKRVPMVFGFDPLFQFLDDDDAALGIATAVEKRPRGIFNVSGPSPVPLSTIAEETGRTVVPVPEVVLRGLLGRLGFPNLPRGALEHIKFPIVVDSSAFRKATGFAHVTGEVEALRRYRKISPV